MNVRRRDFLIAASVLATVRPAVAQSPATMSGSADVVLSGGHVVSLDPAIGELTRGDVLVREGRIAKVAPAIPAPGVPRRDLAGCVVMPGLVDTHWHMWNTIARGLPTSRLGPFSKTMQALAKVWTPEASALGVRLAAAEAIHAGITTVNNWAHNVKAPEFAEAELAALRASGLRGRFSYGYPQALRPDEVMDLDGLREMKDTRFADGGGLIDLGISARGPDRSAGPVWRREWAAARELGLPITTHIASDRAAAAMGSIGTMHREGFLGPDVQLVHATHAEPDDFRRMAEAGSPLSISPWTELEVGYGLPVINDMAASGVEMGLSVDNMVLAGHADMFGVMRLTADLAAGMAETQAVLLDRQVLEWATVGGAHGLGLGDVAGSLTPGKRADVIAVRADVLNGSPVGSVDFFLTHAAQPANVDFVMIDGVVHKDGGRLVRVDRAELLDEAERTIADLRKRSGVDG